MLKTYISPEGLELVIDEISGEVYASIRGAARLVGVNASTISRFRGVAKMVLKTAQVLTPSGLQGVALFNEDQLLELIAKYKPQLLLAFAKAGMRLGLQRLVNYEMSSHSVMQVVDTSIAELRDQHRIAHNIMQWASVN